MASTPTSSSCSTVSVRSVDSPLDEGLRTDAEIGSGDTHAPFSRLAASLRLPQTATLSIRAPAPVPLLDFEAYQWWDSFDLLTGTPLVSPNPTKTLDRLMELLEYLVDERKGGWRIQEVHLFSTLR